MKNNIIVPNLVYIQTYLKKIYSFELCDDINFFWWIENNWNSNHSIFQYTLLPIEKVTKKNTLSRIWNFNFTENSVFYEKKIFWCIHLYFEYCLDCNIFFYSNFFSKIPFQIWSIFPLGKYVSAIIRYDLFLNNILTILWWAFKFNGKNYIVLGESHSWKTTLINMMLKEWWEYISEDMVILNFNNKKIYSTSITSNMGRNSNIEIQESLKFQNINKDGWKIDEIIFLWKKEAFKWYIQMHWMNFLENPFMKSYVAKKTNLIDLFNKSTHMQKELLNEKIIFENNLNKIKKIVCKY